MNRLTDKISEMRNQRCKLENELRAEMQDDDVTRSITIHGADNKDAVFQEELKKHQTKVQVTSKQYISF